MKHRIVAMFLALCLSAIVSAAPPYNVTSVEFTLPTTGGTVDSVELLIDGLPVGTITEADQTLDGVIPAEGTYTFQLRFTNAAGSSVSNSITRSIGELAAPGSDGQLLNVQFSCNESGTSCVLVIS